MFWQLFAVLSTIIGIVFSVLVGGALLTYIRRTWQVIRSEQHGSVQDQMLDELDQIRTVGYLTAERLQRIESLLEEQGLRLPPASRADEDEPGSAGDVGI